MLFECSHCGAPIDARSAKRVVQCPYCGYQNKVDQTRTLAAVTPEAFQQPATWTPPSTARAPSVQLAYRRQRTGVLVIVAVMGFVGVGLVGIFGVLAIAGPGSTGAGPAGGIAPARVAAVDPASSRAEIAAQLGVVSDPDLEKLIVNLDGHAYKNVSLGFDERETHVVGAHFWTDGPVAQRAAIAQALTAVLGRRARTDEDGDLRYDHRDGHLSLTSDGATVWFEVSEDAPQPRRRVAVLWSLLWSVLLGQPSVIDEATRREILTGQPLGVLANLDLSTNLDGADSAVTALAPGSEREVGSDVEYGVAVDHPWFENVELRWDNEPGGVLLMAIFHGHQHVALDPFAVVACLKPVFGDPEERITNYAEGRRDYEWPNGVSQSMGALRVSFGPHVGTGLDQASWSSMIHALEACGSQG